MKKMQENAYFNAMMTVAQNKLAQMPDENARVVLNDDGSINVRDLPTLKAAMGMSLNSLIYHLRYSPFSRYFGQTLE